jgi:hypothetical protein
MNRREMISLVAGLVVGLLVGMVVIGSSDDLRTDLFGTASNELQDSTEARSKDLVFYLVDLPTAQEWLADKYPNTGEEVSGAVDNIAKLSTSTQVSKDVLDNQDDVDVVLPHMYGALTNAENPVEVKVEPDSQTSVCLGLDDDPYNAEPALYLYLTVTSEQAKDAGVPKEWQTLKEPKTNELYWTLLDCFPKPDAE